MQLWGGLECTVNRVGDRYVDQCRLNGHHDRSGDLDLFAELGIKALRYPILWERVAPDDRPPDWRWTDERLRRLRVLNVQPIAGLVHHGGGPLHTNLLDPDFPAKLGRYAGMVAERYPWIEDWTPVNEPLTTARFAALYGFWHPHTRSEDAFWTALVNQIDGVRAAMRAVRRVNPVARLIQTDDLGRTYATGRLADQAAFDNQRRWAGWDLLFGRVLPGHALWDRLEAFGLGDRLRAMADEPYPPDVVGVNHYLTSDRFLDHRLERYPPHTHGGNGRTRYADVEAIRVVDPAPAGLAGALREAWGRYRVPLAVTELHNGCTREEQLRWAAEGWDTAVALRAQGVDVRAVTAWSLLGSHGWNTLLTGSGAYEPGVFDVAAGAPRPTALAKLWQGLPVDAPRHPVADEPGWWRRPDRLIYPPLARAATSVREEPRGAGRPLVILGATEPLGRAFARACVGRGLRHLLVDRATLTGGAADGIAATLDQLRPWGVVDTTRDGCVADAVALARACADRDIGCVRFSSDLVFGGAMTRPYVESDRLNPCCGAGRDLAAMEAGCAGLPGVLVVRTSAPFAPEDVDGIAAAVVRALARDERFVAADDHPITPTFVPWLVDAALDLLIDGAEGFWHLAGDEAVSPAEFARRVAIACDLDPDLVTTAPAMTLRCAALASERGAMPGTLGEAVRRFAQERPRGPAPSLAHKAAASKPLPAAA